MDKRERAVYFVQSYLGKYGTFQIIYPYSPIKNEEQFLIASATCGVCNSGTITRLLSLERSDNDHRILYVCDSCFYYITSRLS